MDSVILDGQGLTLPEIEAVSLRNRPVEIAAEARARMAASRATIEDILAAGQTVYGVNTGFGKLSDVRIPPESLAQLQTNLVRSHAAGVGNPLSEAESRAMLLLARQRAGQGLQRQSSGTGRAAGGDAQCGRASGDSGKRLGGRERRPGSAGAPGAGGDRRGRSVLSRRADGRRRGDAARGPRRRWHWLPRRDWRC